MAAELPIILTILLLLVVVKFCQLAVYPYLRPALPKIAYGLAYPISILLLTLISWYLGLLQLPVQLSLIPFAALLLRRAAHPAASHNGWSSSSRAPASRRRCRSSKPLDFDR